MRHVYRFDRLAGLRPIGGLSMYTYIFRSILFQGLDQKRVVITNFPIKDEGELELLVNSDNNYDVEKQWKLTKESNN